MWYFRRVARWQHKQTDQPEVAKVRTFKMNTHFVIDSKNVILHSSSIRGCKQWATLNHKGRVVTAQDIATIEALRAAQNTITAMEKNAAEERKALCADFGSTTYGHAPYLVTHANRYEFRGELGRAMMAFCMHEQQHKVDVCGSWNGGTYYAAAGVYYGWLSPAGHTASPADLVAKLSAYATRAYGCWSRQGDSLGMRIAAELIAALTTGMESITFVRE